MSRILIAWLPVGLVVIASGCAMCANPYDESAPTLGALCGDACQPGARAGSILAGPYGPASSPIPMEGEVIEGEPTPAPDPGAVPEPSATPAVPDLNPTPEPPVAPPAPAAAPSPDVSKFFPGVPRESIISVTDQKVGDADAAAPADAEPQVLPEQGPKRVPVRSTGANGWSARRPRLRQVQ